MVASSKNCMQFQIRLHIPYPISDQNGSKTIPFGAAHTLYGLYKRVPPSPGRNAPSRLFLCANRVIFIDMHTKGNIKSHVESICLCVLAREALTKTWNKQLVSLAGN